MTLTEQLSSPEHLGLPEQQIRELAYQIWESEGKPHGQDARHWDIACKLAAESLAPSPASIATTAPKKPRARKDAAAPETTIPAAAAAPAKAPRTRKASVTQQADAPVEAAPAAKPARKTKAKSTEPQMS